MRNFILEPGGSIVFGGGCVREYLACFARKYGPNVLLVSGSRSSRENGAWDEIISSLHGAGKRIAVFSGVRPGPDYETVQRGARLARERQVDLILGVGGGSVIDCCKAISMAAVYRGDLWADFWTRQGVVDFQPLPVGIVPTTLGTGELNGAIVLTCPGCGPRQARNYPKCAPRFILFDPLYTRTLPGVQIVSDGFRILSRALELYLAPHEEAYITDGLLESLMWNVVCDLRTPLARNRGDFVHGDLMWAGALVGNDLLRAGKQCGYPCRRKALQLVEQTGRNFTDCLAVLQMSAYRAACGWQPDKLACLAVRVWGIAPAIGSEKDLALAGADALEVFLRDLELPTRFSELGMEEPAHPETRSAG